PMGAELGEGLGGQLAHAAAVHIVVGIPLGGTHQAQGEIPVYFILSVIFLMNILQKIGAEGVEHTALPVAVFLGHGDGGVCGAEGALFVSVLGVFLQLKVDEEILGGV